MDKHEIKSIVFPTISCGAYRYPADKAYEIAGAYYGFSGIPEKWSSSIVMANEIKQWANDLATTGQLELEKTR